MNRVTLLPHRNDWSEIERDAVTMLECHIANRGSWRRGDVERTPLTLSHIQWWLRKTGARRCGRDYAREVLATLVRMELLRDTGQVMTPRRQPRKDGRSYWWRIFEVIPVTRLKDASRKWTSDSLDTVSRGFASSTVSLCGWLRCQGVIRSKLKPVHGSVQWAFASSGPP